jgi:hypothetical protein
MNRKISALVAVVMATAMIAPAWAGEVNGSSRNPKDDFSQGVSICKFSGLNDNPSSTDPANPGGRTQNYGQLVQSGAIDPTDPGVEYPGFLCNPNNLPIGH